MANKKVRLIRTYATSRDVIAGCFECYRNDPHWFGGNAQGVAARHHDATGHITWVEVSLSIRYGKSRSAAANKATNEPSSV